MPSTRPTVDPVLDILEEMGYDFDELEGDGYKRSIKEAMIKSHPDKGGDSEKFIILNEEWQKLRKGGSKPTGVKEKRTTIKGDKLMGKETKKDAPITDKSKLLPGAGFEPKDAAPEPPEAEQSRDDSKVDKIIQFLNGEVKDKLDEINSSIGEIKDVVGAQGDLAEERRMHDERISYLNLAQDRYTFIKADLCNKYHIEEIISEINPDCIFHLAAESHVDKSICSPENFIQSNVVGTFNLLESIRI